MKKFNYDIGKTGEDLVVNYLKTKNYSILFRNYRTKNAEIDIIAKFHDIICFVEVKSRFNFNYGTPMESVVKSKQNKIISASKLYINRYNLYDFFIRYDIAEVFFELNQYKYKINYLEDAFRTY